MAFCGRIKCSSLPLLQKFLKFSSVSTPRSPVGQPPLYHALNSFEFSRNYATASGEKEEKVKLTMAHKGEVQAVVTSGVPLPPEEEKELKEMIGHGKKVKLEQKIDPSILGGLVVEFDQKMFDVVHKDQSITDGEVPA